MKNVTQGDLEKMLPDYVAKVGILLNFLKQMTSNHI